MNPNIKIEVSGIINIFHMFRAKFLALLKEKKQFQLIDEFIDYYGIMRIMKDIYEEDIKQNNLENSLLYNSCIEVCSNEKDNSLFKVAYKIKKDIIKDFRELSYMDFLVKYKMY